MTRVLCALMVVLTLASSGCSLVIGSARAVSAESENRHARERHQPEPASTGQRFLSGFLVGAAVDALVVLAVVSMAPDFNYGESDCNGC